MYPHERSLVEEMRDEPFALIGVNSDELEEARKAVQENNLTWRSFQDSVEGKPTISEEWLISGWPTILVLDAERRIHYRGHDGDKATEIALTLVEKLKAEAR